MRYWQITTRRLSKAAQKLVMDEAWHPFQSTPLAWYRVWKKKIVQRLNFSSQQEQEMFLERFQNIPPLPEMATVSGFREELSMHLDGETLYAEVPLGYAPDHVEDLSAFLSEYGINLRPEEQLLYARIPIPELTIEELARAQEAIVGVRLYFQAASQGSDASTREAARNAFRQMVAAEE
jgi:hypothetical protein